jgi:predicted 3-demethylubiquinone-9 3-methyltransferase (glyoxalase superfamily)
MQKITPFLWYDKEAEEAAKFYTSLFKNSRILNVDRFQNTGPAEDMTVTVVTFELDGLQFQAMNAGPEFKFNESFSMLVDCEDQAEVDRLWTALTANGGEESMCGWLKDKYGLSWQIVPRRLNELLADPNKEKAGRAMKAMLHMQKLDVAALEAAAAGSA